MVLLRPEVGGPKEMVLLLEGEKVKSPGWFGRAAGAAVGILWVLRWVTFGDGRAFMLSERGILEGEGDATGMISETGLVEGEKLTCFFAEGVRWRCLEGVVGSSGRSLFRERGLVGSGR